MSQETINLLIGALIGIVSSLLTLIVGNIFQQENDKRKRNWELEDREYNKRIAVRDMRIKEAREYIEAFGYVVNLQSFIVNRLKMETDVNGMRKAMKSIDQDGTQRLDSMWNIMLSKRGNLTILGDDELMSLADSLNLHFSPSLNKLVNILDKADDAADFDIAELNLDELEGSLSEAKNVIIKMKIRLDILEKIG